MSWRGVLAVAAGAVCGVASLTVTGAASAEAVPAVSGPGAAAGAWGKAIEVPGLGALTKRSPAAVNFISCFSAGNCEAAGTYGPQVQAFVVSESKGRWGKAMEVPGLAALPQRAGGINDFLVSCGSTGNCALGGDYLGPKDGSHAFVASENNGSWGKAMRVPGLSALNTGNDAQLTSMSCSPGRSCAAGGDYKVTPNGHDAFVVSERNGRWGTARPVPGLKPSEFARLRALSCASAGNCSAGGSFDVGPPLPDGRPGEEGFVAVEKNGAWGKAIVLPGLEKLNGSGQAEVDDITCAAAGDCTAGGTYLHGGDFEQAFVATEKNGIWGKAITVPGLATLNARGFADVESISCPSSDNCALAGTYLDSGFDYQGYVAVEKNGAWGKAIEVPGLGALNQGKNVEAVELSCGSTGNCVAGGEYLVSRGGYSRAFLASLSDGLWGKATQVPGLSTLSFGSSGLYAISCPAPDHCAAGGTYQDRSGNFQGFVVSQK